MMSQLEKGRLFRALHERAGAFISPNPWDVGTARLLGKLGFEALATTSAGCAFSAGRRDGTLSREETLTHAAGLVAATELPVSADLENGFGESLEEVAETYRLAGNAGLVGASIEDATGRPEEPIFDLNVAVERVQAAVAAVRALPFPFTLTGRAENYLWGRADLGDTIKRLQAYQEAGADVLYAPGLTTREEIREVVNSVDRPVNVVMGLKGARFTLTELGEWGVKRVSVGSALYRAAAGAFLRAATEMRETGSFGFAESAVGYAELGGLLV